MSCHFLLLHALSHVLVFISSLKSRLVFGTMHIVQRMDALRLVWYNLGLHVSYGATTKIDVHDTADGPQVGLVAVSFLLQHLGGDVVRRAADSPATSNNDQRQSQSTPGGPFDIVTQCGIRRRSWQFEVTGILTVGHNFETPQHIFI